MLDKSWGQRHEGPEADHLMPVPYAAMCPSFVWNSMYEFCRYHLTQNGGYPRGGGQSLAFGKVI